MSAMYESFDDTLSGVIKQWFVEQVAPEYLDMIDRPARIMMDEDGSASLIKGRVDVRWRLLPTPIYSEVTIAKVSFDMFKGMILGDSKTRAFRELGLKIASRQLSGLTEMDNHVAMDLASHIVKSLAPKAREVAAKMAMEKEFTDFKAVKATAQEIVDQALASYKDEVTGYLEDELVQEIESLWKGAFDKVVKNIIDVSKQYAAIGTQNVFPKNVKYFFASGDQALVVVEEEPRVRTIVIDQSYFTIAGRTERGMTRMRLAFPYTVFFIRLIGGQIQNMTMAYSLKPIESRTDQLYLPNLPNFDSAANMYRICTQLPGSSNRDVYREIQRGISHFWESRFNSHWTGNVYFPAGINTGSGGAAVGFKKWEDLSIRDHTFALEPETWRKGYTLEDYINHYGSGIAATKGGKAVDRNTEEVIRAFGEEFRLGVGKRIAKKLKENLTTKNKFGKVTVQKLEEHLRRQIKAAWSMFGEDFFQAFPDSLNPALVARFHDTIVERFHETVQNHFEELSEEVPIRLQATPLTLSENMLRRKLKA
ncbi:hypothetical protein IPM19_03000 [bacterium]|nr:MAG: hypothetical protein IPM19_03000 [bacterium]